MFSNVETGNVRAVEPADSTGGSEETEGAEELQTENVDKEESSLDVENKTEQRNNAETEVENSLNIDNNNTDTDVDAKNSISNDLEGENCVEDIDAGYNVNNDNEMSEPPRRELVSHMIPLKDPDDPDIVPNTFSGRTSPWPLEDGTAERTSPWSKEMDYGSSQLGHGNESTSYDLEEENALDTSVQELEKMMLGKNRGSTKLKNETDKTKSNQNELLKHSLTADDVHLDNANSNIELLRLGLEQSLRLTKSENNIETFKFVGWKDITDTSQIRDCSTKAIKTSTSNGSNVSSVRGSNVSSVKGGNLSSSRKSNFSSRSGSSCSTSSVRTSNDIQAQTTAQKVGTEDTLIKSGARSRRASPTLFKTAKQVEPVR